MEHVIGNAIVYTIHPRIMQPHKLFFLKTLHVYISCVCLIAFKTSTITYIVISNLLVVHEGLSDMYAQGAVVAGQGLKIYLSGKL